jgi:hypothetical protein
MNHFETTEQYFKLNEKYSTEFIKTRFYETVSLAVYDISFSLLQFLSHRPKIAMIRQGSSVFELMIPIFLRQQTPIQFKTETQNSLQFLADIDKQTNFLLWSAENEITGEIIYSEAQCLEIHKILSDLRIFSVQIVNSSRNINKSEILKNKYSIIIETAGIFLDPQTQIFYTEKMKAPSLIGPFQKINFNLSPSESSLGPDYELSLISDYEYSRLFVATKNYLTDRKVFVFKNCSGEMIMQKLIEKKSIQSDQIFSTSSLPTGVLDTFKNWWPEAVKPDLLLGLLVISKAAFFQNTNLESEIKSMYQKIQSDTTWVVG